MAFATQLRSPAPQGRPWAGGFTGVQLASHLLIAQRGRDSGSLRAQ